MTSSNAQMSDSSGVKSAADNATAPVDTVGVVGVDAAAANQPDVPNTSDMPERVHVDARGLSLAIIATVALLFAINSAEKFLVPLLFGIFIAYTLNPVVVWLERIRIPRLIGASLIMLVLLGGMAGAARTLTTEFMSITQSIPEMAHKLSRQLIRNQSNQPGAIQRMQAAATEIASATSGEKARPPVAAPVVSPASRVSDLLVAGSMGAAGFLGEAVVVMFLIFFLLLSGDTFKRKLVKLTGPSLSNKKITVHILDDINTSIQKYMFMLLVTNSLLSALMWVAFRMIGLENAGAWAVGAGLLHVIPYFGPLLITVGTGLAAFMQFETVGMALLAAVTSLTIATLVGTFVTTWMTGRIAKMNATAVFISLLFWGWMWGVWGMLLGVPIVVIIRVVSEHVEGWEPVAELLGD
jgi:predicted PurR-regulated permease PerM